MSWKRHRVWLRQRFMSVGFGWVHLSKQSSFSGYFFVCVCLLLWHFQRGGSNSFSSSSPLYPILVLIHSLKLPQAVALPILPMAEYSVSLAAETTPHLSSGHLANHCQNCFVAPSPAKSLSQAMTYVVYSLRGPKAIHESLFSATP